MENLTRRELLSGKAYDALIPRPQGRDHSIREDAGVDDTLKLIRKTVPQTAWHTERLAPKLKGKNLHETCNNIWQFVYRHIAYKKDATGREQVRSPRRSWFNRYEGVDCDCYTEFISSILYNLGIPHKYRIAAYDPERGWQHIYPIVPLEGRTDRKMDKREDYIVIDCVKDAFDDEQPFIDSKDYNSPMKLEYLDGLEGSGLSSVDIDDLMAEEQMGSIFSKIGNAISNTAKKVVSTAGDAIRVVNRYANPATVLLRNGFLAAMKINFMNVAGRLRYGYLSESQARAMGMNMDAWKKLKRIVEKAENTYYDAGGLKENLKKAILDGKGNRDKKVPLNGLEGLGELYADPEEYRIMQMQFEGLGQLGEPVTAAAITAATAAVSAVALALKDIKNLFSPNTPEAQQFSSENEEAVPENGRIMPNSMPMPSIQVIPNNNSSGSSTTSSTVMYPAPSGYPLPPGVQNLVPAVNPNSQAATGAEEDKKGFFDKTKDWIKSNPVPSSMIGVVLLAGSGYVIFRATRKKKKKRGKSLSGISRKKAKSTGRRKKQKIRLQTISI